MVATQRLEFRQSQTLVITPQLQQAIKLLQLSNQELSNVVEQEIAENPLLELDENRPDLNQAVGNDEGNEPGSSQELPDTYQSTHDGNLPAESDLPLDTNYDTYFDGDHNAWSSARSPTGSRSSSGQVFDAGESPEALAVQKRNLRDLLLDQLNVDVDGQVERLVGVHLIDCLDESGYVTTDLTEIAETLGTTLELVETVLAILQKFEPTGVFARSLKECLALQLADRNRLDPAMASLLDHLDLVAKRDVQALCQVCDVDQEDVADMMAELRSLNPKPGLEYSSEPAEPIIPDILMRNHPNGGWMLELNSDTLPRVLVNQQYYARVIPKVRDKKEREFIAEKLQSANWLAKALEQRATTILRAASEVVRQQEGFFKKGVQHLRPLTLRDVAEAIEMHESTISRATANKFIATPRGMFELRYFFTGAIAGTNGSVHAAEAVRERIKALIRDEEPKAILSDDHIVERLRQDGIDIARRTVAKYREAMRIPSSVQRRREKKFASLAHSDQEL